MNQRNHIFTCAWLCDLSLISMSIQNWEFFDLFLEIEEVALNELLVLEPQQPLHLRTFQFDSKVLRPQRIQYCLHFHCNDETFLNFKVSNFINLAISYVTSNFFWLGGVDFD